MAVLYEGAREFGIALTPEQLERFDLYYRQLVDWNAKINLTAITEYTQVLVKHFLDSLSVARALPQPFERALDGKKLIDIGAGGGFPGMPLAIAFPQLQVTLLEAAAKKALALDEILRALDLPNVLILHGRAEEFGRMAQYREGYDFATARAVAELRTLAEYTLPFVRVGGMLIAQKSLKVKEETEAAAHALQVLGGRVRERLMIQLPRAAEARYLVIVDKIAPTPEKYPRRPGMAEKKPL